MMSTTIKAGEGFTVQQILDSNGFTLDTTDFPDLLDEEEERDYSKCAQLDNEEMLRLLNLEEESDNKENIENEKTAFVGIAFDTIRPKMNSIYKDGQVMKLIRKEGVGEVVPSDAQVTVEYVGYFEYQDEPFDTTLYHKDKKAVFRLGQGAMIPGLEIAISSMKKFEKALFLIQPCLAFGKLGCLPRIPPDAEVLFKVELLNFLDNGAAELYEELSNEEKKKFSAIQKIVRDLLTTANDNYKRQKVKQAIREYNRVVKYLESARLENDEEEKEMNKHLTRALTNLTVCYNKIQKPKLACSCFQRLPSKNGKAYYQNGKALGQLGEYDEAMESLCIANKMTPGVEEILKEIQKIEARRSKYLEFSKRFAQKSLKIEKGKNNDEFEKVAIEMCDSFINDDNLLKQLIPNGLTLSEQECMRRVAASRGLSISKLNRFNVETSYLTKKDYYTREMI